MHAHSREESLASPSANPPGASAHPSDCQVRPCAPRSTSHVPRAAAEPRPKRAAEVRRVVEAARERDLADRARGEPGVAQLVALHVEPLRPDEVAQRARLAGPGTMERAG